MTASETVPLSAAANRRIALPVNCNQPLPSSMIATRDGIAVFAEDTFGSSPYNPQPLPAGSVQPVSVGEPLSGHANAVCPWESIHEDNATFHALEEVNTGDGVCFVGRLLPEGAVAVRAGRILSAADLALLALIGRHQVSVYSRPRVQILFMTDERMSGMLRTLLSPLLLEDEAVIRERECQRGSVETLTEALGNASTTADLILVLGGTGFGVDDVAATALERAGELKCHGLGLRPGMTAGAGLVGGVPVILVPGAPLSAQATYDTLIGPALRRLGGLHEQPHRTVNHLLKSKVSSTLGLVDYIRVSVDDDGLAPRRFSTDLDLPALAATDGFFLVSADSEGYAPGTPVTVCVDRA